MKKTEDKFPGTQYAVQLVGPGDLKLTGRKPVLRPTGHQILAKVEATGLCFSDLKLFKQFGDHPRKTEVVSGIDREVLDSNPSYVPGLKPTVLGHETVVTIVDVGDKVRNHRIGERCLVQTDYRGIKTAAGSNAAFGYNFEGGLQEYVIIDERMSKDMETGERFLIPVRQTNSASAVCLAEPWACVEDSYLNVERRTVKTGGRLLIVAERGFTIAGVRESFASRGRPAIMSAICADAAQKSFIMNLIPAAELIEDLSSVPDFSCDDIIYFGADKDMLEALSAKLAGNGIINIVTCGKKVGRSPAIGIGRIHYGLTRWIGTVSGKASESYSMIPRTGELRPGDKCLVVGAGGPMGQMHVLRNICAGIPKLSITATDFDESRLKSLARLAEPLAKKHSVKLKIVNPQKNPLKEKFTYAAIMVPVPQLVIQAIADADKGCLINIFAGIPAQAIAEIDLDTVIANRCFIFGTSGSTLHDMRVVLQKVEKGQLDTNASVDAVSGMAGAIEGINAVEKRTLTGKIIVYPQLHELGLTPLSELAAKLPTVAAKLRDGIWTKEAEQELFKVAR